MSFQHARRTAARLASSSDFDAPEVKCWFSLNQKGLSSDKRPDPSANDSWWCLLAVAQKKSCNSSMVRQIPVEYQADNLPIEVLRTATSKSKTR